MFCELYCATLLTYSITISRRAGARDLEAPPNTTREALPPFPSPPPLPSP